MFSENFRTDLAASFFFIFDGINDEILPPKDKVSSVGFAKNPFASGKVISTLARLFLAAFKNSESREKDCKTGSDA